QLVSGRSRNNRVESSDKERKSRSSIANSCDNLSNPSNSHVKLSNNALNSRKDCLAFTSILTQQGGWFSAGAENLPYKQLVSGRSRNNRVTSSDKEYKSRSSIANSCDNLSKPSNSHIKMSNNALNTR